MVWNKLLKIALKEAGRRFSSKSFSPRDLNGKVGIIGVPFGKGQKKKGKEEAGLKMAPDIIRFTGILKDIESLGVEVCDLGNLTYEPLCDLTYNNMNNLNHFVPCVKTVAEAVNSVLESSKSCLVLGGDHSISTGSIYAHLDAAGHNKVAVVYVDAHADLNTASSSPSGNIHGMTLGLLARELQQYWPEEGVPGMNWLCPSLSLKNVAYIGLRSVDSGEAKFLQQNDVAVFAMDEIEKCGIHKVLSRALAKIDPTGCKSIHLSFDIDALDYLEAPCTTVPVRGGLTLREGIEIGEFFYKTGRLSVVDFVEVNTALGNEIQKQMTLDAAKNLLLALYGHCRRGNYVPDANPDDSNQK